MEDLRTPPQMAVFLSGSRVLIGIQPPAPMHRRTDRANLRNARVAGHDFEWFFNRSPGCRRSWSISAPAIVAVVAYLFVYTRITPHNEFELIRANEPAAAIALGLSLLGFVLPLVSAIAHSANVWDCLIWASIALIVQIIVYFLVRVPVPKLSKRIAARRAGRRRSGSGSPRSPPAPSTPPA